MYIHNNNCLSRLCSILLTVNCVIYYINLKQNNEHNHEKKPCATQLNTLDSCEFECECCN